MKKSDLARQDFLEYVKTGDCPCCFPYWEYESISKLDVWKWEDDDDCKRWIDHYSDLIAEDE